jgi:hypothetical protein
MSRRHSTLATGTILATALVLSSCAGEAPSDAFKQLDANADGYIDQSEAQSAQDLVQSWTAVDANQDGRLDVSEFSAFEMPAAEGEAATMQPAEGETTQMPPAEGETTQMQPAQPAPAQPAEGQQPQ